MYPRGATKEKKYLEVIIMSVQATVQSEMEKMKNTIKREVAIENELQNYKAEIEHIAELQEASEP